MEDTVRQALGALIWGLGFVKAEDEVVDVETGSESESMLGTLDYVLLAAITGAAVWWFFIREGESDEIPEYEIKPMAAPSSPDSGGTTEKGFLAKMKKTNRRMVVFYGSQTGTAEEFAGRLAKEGARYGLKGLVADPEEEDMDELQRLAEVEEQLEAPCLAVFMVATYGEGDPTDNAVEFHEKLTSDGMDLSGMKYAVFGLGNKTYEHFNAMAKFCDSKMEELGGKRVHILGSGDDDANLEDDFITWKEAFWSSVCAEFKIEASSEDFNTRQYEHKVLGEGDYKEEKVYKGEVARLRSYITQRPPFDVKNPFLAPITVNRNLHGPDSGRHGLHIELNVEGSRIRYDAGDHVAVYPTNNLDLVNSIGTLLNIDMDQVFSMTNVDEDSSKKHPFPCPTTYRTALSHYVEITALPRTHILKELAKYTSDPEERAKLELMTSTSAEGKAMYQAWVVDGCRHLGHILTDLPSCKPPVDHLLELLPRLQPRFYSIASSGKAHPTSIHICGVVVEYQIPDGRTNLGVCTTWLKEKVTVGEGEDMICPKVPVYVRRSQFRLPNRPSTPVIMIGPGTGLAPFRGFIQERAWQKSQGKQVGPTILFFGCRNKAHDYIYQEELEEWEKDGLLTLNVAFSRDQAEKRYVSHLLREKGEDMWKLLDEQAAHLYVCGDAKMMAKDVRNIITELCREHGKMTETEAENFVKKLESQKRYSADVWS